MIAGIRATPEDVERIRHALGLDQPFLVQLGGYIGRLLQGDFGHSYIQNRAGPVAHPRALPGDAPARRPGLLVELAIGVPLGIFAATRRGIVVRSGSTILTIVLVSAPSFLVGYLLLNFLAFQPQVAGRRRDLPDRRLQAVRPALPRAAGDHPGLQRRPPTTRG